MADIRELAAIEDLRELAELLAVVWGRPGSPPINSDVLKALVQSGNYVTAAYGEERMIGGLVGWFGGVPHDTHVHSHILGVLPESEARGVGFTLKQHQRRWCLERGVKVIEWTTDPLVRRNGHFNLTKLGARAAGYLVNVYGAMRDGINSGEESDRLVIRWQLDSAGAEAAAGGRAVKPDIDALDGQVILEVGASGEPVTHARSASARVLLCQVPADIVEVRRADPALARAWRRALRVAMTEAIESGSVVTGATRSGWYVLESRPT